MFRIIPLIFHSNFRMNRFSPFSGARAPPLPVIAPLLGNEPFPHCKPHGAMRVLTHPHVFDVLPVNFLVYLYLVYLFTVEQVEDMRNLNKIGGISTIKTSKLVLYCLRFALSLHHGKRTDNGARALTYRTARATTLQGYNLQRRFHDNGFCRTCPRVRILQVCRGGGDSDAQRPQPWQCRRRHLQLRRGTVEGAQGDNDGEGGELPAATGV